MGTAGKLAALLVKKKMAGLKKTLDYAEAGGAPLMGVRKPVIKAHGSSNAKAIMNAIHQADLFAQSGAIDAITQALSEAGRGRGEKKHERTGKENRIFLSKSRDFAKLP